MLYTLYGTDFKKARKHLRTLVDSLLKRKPDANVFTLTPLTFSSDRLDELVGGQGLFSEKYIVILDGCLQDPLVKEDIFLRIKNIAESDNVCVILEETLDAKSKKILEKYSEQIKVYEIPKERAGKVKNPFAITEAVGRRDKKEAWIIFRKTCMEGASAEEVHSIVLWQIKAMIQARESKSALEAGLKPFVYTKSKGFLKNYPADSLDSLYKNMIRVYHEARRGKMSMEEGLETLLLLL